MSNTALMDAIKATAKADPNSVAAMLIKALTEPKPGTKFAKKAKKKPQVENTDRKAAFAAAVVATFAENGIAVTPNVDVFTYNRWVERGFKPSGKSVRVKIPGRKGTGMPLWHRSMVEPLTAGDVVTSTTPVAETPKEAFAASAMA